MWILIKRTLAAALWCFFAVSTILSFLSNSAPKWFDYASAAPLFIVLIALVFGRERLLFEDLDGWLAKLGRRVRTKSHDRTLKE